MRFETFVALRYLRGKRKSRFISLITLISVGGVSIGVIALIVVLSVMTGFDKALTKDIKGNNSDLVVENLHGGAFDDFEQVIHDVRALCPEVVAAAPLTQFESILRTKHGDREEYTGGFVAGIDPEREPQVTQILENLSTERKRTHGAGKLPGEKEILLGYRLADKLGVGIGDEVQVFTPRQTVAPMGMREGRGVWLTVCGLSEAQNFQIDMFQANVDLATAAMITGNRGVCQVHFKLTDSDQAAVIAERIDQNLPYNAISWFESQQGFLGALKQEKLAMFIILVFIIMVAAFNIMSTLIMLVMEKRQDIGILRTIGVSGGSILQTFIIEGFLIGFCGTVLGVILGVILAYNINPVAEFLAYLFNIDLFNSEYYYFDAIPVAVVPFDVFWITFSTVVLTFVSTLYPAWSASRIDPVEALRNE